jgi:hypothetical protein
MAGHGRAATERENPREIIQPCCKPPDAEKLDPGGRQVDRQGNAIQRTADLANQGSIVVTQFEAVVARRGPLDEELHGREPQCLGGTEPLRCGRTLQRPQAAVVLALDAQRFAAGCKNVHARRAFQDGHGQTCNVIDNVQTVVEHEQHAGVAKCCDQARERILGIDVDADGSGHRARHEAWICEPPEVDLPNTILIGADQLLGRGYRDGGLADPARPDKGDEPFPWQPVDQLGDEISASEQGR